MIQIHDNFLPKEIFNHVCDVINAKDFPWFFIDNVSYRNRDNHLWNEAFSTTLYSSFDIEYKSPGFFHLKDMFEYIEKTCDLKMSKLLRAKANLYTTSLNNEAFQPHIDEPSYNTIIGILYINDSDGDTILYDQISHAKTSDDVYEESKNIRFTPIHSIKHIANRMVLFEGNRYHSGCRPMHNKTRININFNWLNNENTN